MTLVLSATTTMAACGDPDTEDVKGQTVEDDAVADTGAVDTGGVTDSGAVATDSGSGAKDAGGPVDTGTIDAGPVDAGPVDAGATDAGPPIDVPPEPAHQCKQSADCAGLPGVDLCLGPLFCDKSAAVWVCKHKTANKVTCGKAKDTACQVNTCVPATGTCTLQNTPKGTPCVDGDACTVDSACDGGKCVAGSTSWCDCKVDADCVKKDANLCTGQVYCDKDSFPYKCRVNPATIVKCNDLKDTVCAKNTCDPKTGKCSMQPVPKGTPCDDGSKATLNDICKDGKCTAGLIPKCTKTEDCKVQEDGNACNGTLFCDKGSGACLVNPATVVTCASANDTPCFKNTCDKATGACEMRAQPNGTGCDDGDKCTAGDACVAGSCKSGKEYTCPCKTNADCVAKDDGDLCNGTYYCHGVQKKCLFNEATKVICPSVDDSACVKNACTPKTGACVPTAAGLVKKACDLPGKKCRTFVANLPKPVTVACDDGNACTQGDECVGTKCVSGTKVCECQSDTECLLQDDGDLCNGVPYCDKTHKDATGNVVPKCKPNPASKVYCAVGSDTACLKNRCDPKTGKCGYQPEKKGTVCDDGEVCTLKDSCVDGACKPGAKNLCDDGDACTQDTCVAGKGCVHPKACDDNKPCTLDTCKDGKCTFDPKPLDGKGCDADNNGCTVNDACKAGVCTKGALVPCAIATPPCHVASCQSTGAKTFQCQVLPTKDGTACSDGDACTLGDACKSGKCAAGGGQKLQVGTVTGGKANTRIKALAALGNDVVYAGAVAAGSGIAGWTVGRIGADRKVAWHREPGPQKSGQPVDLGALAVWIDAAGQVVAAGGMLDGATRKARLVRYSDNGTATTSTWYAPKPNLRLGAAMAHPSGGAVLAGTHTDGAKTVRFLARLSASGATLWHKTHSKAILATAMTARAGGGFAVVGLRGGDPSASAYLVDSAGNHECANTLTGGVSFTSLAATAQGLVAAGRLRHNNATVSGVGRVLDDCSLDTKRSLFRSGSGAATAIVAAGAGVAIAAGRVGSPKSSPTMFAVGTATGDQAWEKTWDAFAHGRFTALTAMADGSIAAAGHIDATGGKLLLARTTPWGHVSCKAAGPCAGESAAKCDDGNPCTHDKCEPKPDGSGKLASSCLHVIHKGNCDDGDQCARVDRCKNGKCAGTLATTCDDGNVCTDDSCSPKTGCSFKKLQGVPCPDNDVCTESELCLNGACATKKKTCNDGNACTKDSCDAKTGCVAVKDWSHCDDGNACTVDICSKLTGCGANPVAKNTPCDDGDACTAGDKCEGKVCKPGGARLWERKALIAQLHHKASYPNMVTGAHFMDVAPNGDTVVAKQAKGGWAIARFNPLGEQIYAKQEHLGHYHGAITQMSTAVANADGSATYFGPSHLKSDGNNNYYGGFLKVSASGSVLAKRRHGPRFNRIRWGAASLLDRAGKGYVGAIILTQGMSNSESYRVRLWSVDAKMDVRYWLELDIGEAHKSANAHSIAGHDDGGAAISHTAEDRWWLSRFGSTGQRLWRRGYPGGTSQMRRYKDGYLVGGSMPRPGGGNNPWIGTTDGEGNLLWSTTVDLGVSDHITALTAMPGGGFMIAGLHKPSTIYGEHNCRLTRLSATGAVQWWRSYQGAKPLTHHSGHKPQTKYHADVCTTLRPVPGGGLQAGGYLTDDIDGNHRTSWLFRVDDWGNISCGETGKCRQKKTADCDDKTACTADTCNAKTGCINANRKGPCDDGNACTGDGSCKDGSCKVGSARLFETTLGDKENNQAAAIVPLALGRVATVENRLVKLNTQAWVRTVDGAGTEEGKYPLLADHAGTYSKHKYPYSYVYGATHLDDGSTLLTGGIARLSHPAPEKMPIPMTWSISPRGEVVGTSHPGKAVAYRGHVACQAPNGRVMAFTIRDTNPTYVDATPLYRNGRRYTGPHQLQAFNSSSALSNCVGTSDLRYVVGAARINDKPSTMQLLSVQSSNGWPSGKVLVRNYGDSRADGQGQNRAIHLLARGGGDVIAVGETNALSHGGWDAWLLRVDKDLVPREQRLIGTVADERVHGAADAPGGEDILVWGSISSASNGTDGFLWRLDGTGRKIWGRSWGGAKNDRLVAMTWTGADGGMALLGDTLSKGAGSTDLWLLKTTPWGQSTCGLAGTCLAKTGSACDDGDPCTADTCDGKAGCKHTVIPGACGERPGCTERFKTAKGVWDWMEPRAEQFAHTYDAKKAQSIVATAEFAGQSIAVGQLGGDGVVHSHSSDGTSWWSTAITGNKVETVTSAAVVAGQLLVGGGSTSSGRAPHGGEDGFVIALDRRGTIRWTRAWGGNEDDRLHALTAGPKAAVYGVGRTKSASLGSKALGNWDGWVTAANGRDGKLVWSRNLGGKGIDYLHDAVWSGGVLYVAGSTRSMGAGGSDGWIARLDATGKVLGGQAFGGPKDDEFRALAPISDTFMGAFGTTAQVGGGDAWYVATDATLKTIKTRTWGHKQLPDEVHGAASLGNGRLVAVGSTSTDNQKRDAWLGVLNDDGKPYREHLYGAAASESFGSVTALRRGGYLVGGTVDNGGAGTAGWLHRTNPWGYADCKKAGKCAWSGPGLCDDNNPCTIDACDPKVGCTHVGDASKCLQPLSTDDKKVSCKALKKANPNAKSGVYRINRFAGYENQTVPAYCDMETDGGGWTLVAAFRADMPATTDVYKAFGVVNWKSTHPAFVDERKSAPILAAQGTGDVNATTGLSRDRMHTIIGSSTHAEVLVDTGAGLFTWKLKPANHHGFKFGVSGIVQGPASVMKSYNKPSIALRVAADVHAPSSTATFTPIAPTFQESKGCASPENCLYFPANTAGRFQQAHRRDGTPGAGFDGARRHPVRIFIR